MGIDTFYITINLFFLFISILLITIQRFKISSSFFGCQNRQFKSDNYLYIFYNSFNPSCSISFYSCVVLLLFCITLFTSVYKVGVVPSGLHVDEAGIAYDALSVANYGVDRYLNPYPVYFINFGGGQSALYTYLAAFFIRIFGYSVICVRLPAILVRLITFVAIYYITGREYRDHPEKTLLLLLIFAVCPYFIMQSRWGLDCNLLVGLLALSVSVLTAAVRHNSTTLYLLSGLSFGLSLYTYALSYIIIPIFLLLTFSYLYFVKRIKMNQVFKVVIPVFFFSVPLMAMILVNKGIIAEYKGLFTIPMLFFYRGGEISLNNIPNNLYIIFSLLSFDNPSIFGRQLFYNAVPYFGTVYYFSIPFFVIGLVSSSKASFRSIKNREFSINTIFLLWLLSVFACQFLIYEPNINKSNAAFIPILFFIVEGIVNVADHSKTIIVGIVFLYMLNFVLFFNYYFYQYNSDSKILKGFATDYVDVIRCSKNLNSEKKVILNNIAAAPYIYILLENQVSPYCFRMNNIKTVYNSFHSTYSFRSSEEIKTDSLHVFQSGKEDTAYIVFNNTDWNHWFNRMGYKNLPFGNVGVFYK